MFLFLKNNKIDPVLGFIAFKMKFSKTKKLIKA